LKKWVFNPALNCPRLMDVEWRYKTGRAFQTITIIAVTIVLVIGTLVNSYKLYNLPLNPLA